MFQCTFRKTSWVRISTQKHSVVQRGRNLSPALVLPTCSAQLAVNLSPQACSAASSSSCRPVRGARRSHPGVLPEDKVWGGFCKSHRQAAATSHLLSILLRHESAAGLAHRASSAPRDLDAASERQGPCSGVAWRRDTPGAAAGVLGGRVVEGSDCTQLVLRARE